MDPPADFVEPDLLLSPPGGQVAQAHTPFRGDAGPRAALDLSGGEELPSPSKAAVAGAAAEATDEKPASSPRPGDSPAVVKESLGPSHPLWTQRKKHAFILTKAAKLLYSRYGDVQGDLGLVSLSALFTAIVSRVADLNDSIRCIETEGHKFVFLSKQVSWCVLVFCNHSFLFQGLASF